MWGEPGSGVPSAPVSLRSTLTGVSSAHSTGSARNAFRIAWSNPAVSSRSARRAWARAMNPRPQQRLQAAAFRFGPYTTDPARGCGTLAVTVVRQAGQPVVDRLHPDRRGVPHLRPALTRARHRRQILMAGRTLHRRIGLFGPVRHLGRPQPRPTVPGLTTRLTVLRPLPLGHRPRRLPSRLRPDRLPRRRHRGVTTV